VVADRGALKTEDAVVLDRLDVDEREVGRAAADVGNEDALTAGEAGRGRRSAGPGDKRIKGGEGLLDEVDVREARLRAAFSVSSRAISSNEAGTVTTTC